MRKLVFEAFLLLTLYFLYFPFVSASNTWADWPMAASDIQKKSRNNVDVRGSYKLAWHRPINSHIDKKHKYYRRKENPYLNPTGFLFIT